MNNVKSYPCEVSQTSIYDYFMGFKNAWRNIYIPVI